MNDAPDARPLTIAIDGPAGAGKSTVARRVAGALGYAYIDTGAMYRAVAWATLKEGVAPDDAEAVTRLAETLDIRLRPEAAETQIWVNAQDITDQIRTPDISNLTSPLSAIPGVRRRMVALQQAMGAAGGVVMEGRDIGTVVLPHADVKVFLTASLEKRAERRQAELASRGVTVDMDALRADIAARDARDGGRDIAPMIPAPDAAMLDSDRLSVDDVVATILRLWQEATTRHAG